MTGCWTGEDAIVHRRPQRHPDSALAGELQFAGHNADDREALSVQPECLANDIPLSGKTRLPQIRGEQGHAEILRSLLLGVEDAPEHGIDSQYRKEIRAYLGAFNARRFTFASQIDATVIRAVSRYLFEA